MATVTVRSSSTSTQLDSVLGNEANIPISGLSLLGAFNQIASVFSSILDSAGLEVATRFISSSSPSPNHLRIDTTNYMIDVVGSMSVSRSTATELRFYDKATGDLVTLEGVFQYQGLPFSIPMQQGSLMNSVSLARDTNVPGYTTTVMTFEGQLSLGPVGFTGAVNSYIQSHFDNTNHQSYARYTFDSTLVRSGSSVQLTDALLNGITMVITGPDGVTSTDSVSITGSQFTLSQINTQSTFATVLSGNDTFFLQGVGSFPANTGSGNDTVVNGPGNTSINGGSGIDTLIQAGNRIAYSISNTSRSDTASFTVSGPQGADTLVGVERIKFADVSLALDITGNAGQAYRLYQAAFDRTPDLPGLGYQINALDSGLILTQVAQHFISSPEFAATYGSLDDVQFVTQLYANVLNRSPEAAGLAFHVNNLSQGLSRAQTLVGFSESPENFQATLVGIQNGMEYVPVA